MEKPLEVTALSSKKDPCKQMKGRWSVRALVSIWVIFSVSLRIFLDSLSNNTHQKAGKKKACFTSEISTVNKPGSLY